MPTSRRLLWVIGAGASAPYGFPTGNKLLDLLTHQLTSGVDTIRRTGYKNIFDELRIDSTHVQKFRDELTFSEPISIDRFLQERKNEVHFVDIGKIAIASTIMRFEESGYLFENRAFGVRQNSIIVDPPHSWGERYSWMAYLWRFISNHYAKSEVLDDLKMWFITFNYDRSLECYLSNVLRNYYGATCEQVGKFIDRHVRHVYGSIGDLWLGPGSSGRAYSADGWNNCEAVSTAASRIKTISEERESRDIEKYITGIRDNGGIDRVVFIGFGYDRSNLDTILRGTPWDNVDFVCSRYGISEIEWNQIDRDLQEYRRGDSRARTAAGRPRDYACYDFLRESPALQNVID